MKKVALITGITGQDGSYLAELLLKKGYKVHGIVRRTALEFEEHRIWRLRKIKNDLNLHAASLENYASLFKVVEKINPDEVYHLASQSYVANSFEDEFGQGSTFPQVVVDGKKLGGCVDTIKFLRENRIAK